MMSAVGFTRQPFFTLKKGDTILNAADHQALTSIYRRPLCLRAGPGHEMTYSREPICLLLGKITEMD